MIVDFTNLDFMEKGQGISVCNLQQAILAKTAKIFYKSAEMRSKLNITATYKTLFVGI